MKRLGRFRFAIYILLAILLLLGGTRWYLTSSYAAARMADKLSALLGTPVLVATVDIGFVSGSVVNELQILDVDGTNPNTSWLIVRELRADLSALNILKGDTLPRQVTLTGATVNLRFDKVGNLITRLPKPSEGPPQTMPKLRLESGKFMISQEGHEHPLVVENVTGQGDSVGRVLTLEGAAHDPYWGDWTVKGNFDLDESRFTLRLHTDRAEVTLDKLKRLPFVSAGVWEEVRIEEGVTSADITLTVQSKQPTVLYRIELEPRDVRLHVSAIELDAEQARGKVVIDNNLVELRDVHAHAAKGTIWTDADLDFRSEASHLDFKTIRVNGANLYSLPDSWNLKQYEIAGKLTGEAKLDVVIKPNGKGIERNGSGEGVITDASFRNLPLSEPVKLNLRTVGSKFRIKPLARQPKDGGPARGAEPTRAARLAAPTEELRLDTEVVAFLSVGLIAPPEDPAIEKTWRLLKDTLVEGASVAATIPQETISAVTTAASTLGRVIKQSGTPLDAETTYLDAELSLKDVDLRKTVEQLGLELPFPVSGKLSIRMQLGVPVDTARDLKAYRMRGTADLPTLSVAGLDLTNVHVGVRLDKGVLRLDELKADFAGASLIGEAELKLEGDYSFTGKAELTRFNLDTLRGLSPNLGTTLPGLGGSVSLSADVRGELRKQTFTASGTAKAADVLVEKARIDALSFKWEAGTDSVRLFDFSAKLYEGEVTGTAVLPLREAVEGNVDIRVREVDALALTKALPAIPVRLDGRVSGSVTATLPAATPDKPREMSARVDLDAPRLRVQNVPTQRLRGNVTYRAGRADYRLEGETLGGTFKLEGRFPPEKPAKGAPQEKEARQPPEEPDGHLTIQNVRLGRLGEVMGRPDALGPLHGRLSATLTYRQVGPNRALIGSGRLRLADLRWGDRILAEDVNAELHLTERDFQIREITALLGEGVLRAVVVLNLRERERSYFTLHLDRADAGRLLAPFPALVDLVDGPLEVNLRGNLGREWSGSGSMALTRGRVLGIGVSEWRMPVSFSLSPTEDRGQIEIRDSVAQIASGRATGGVKWSWGNSTRLEGAFRFINADVQALSARTGSLRTVAVGKVTGHFDFSSSEFRTVDDLNGVLEARLTQSQALELPVLINMVPFLAPGQSATTFQSGDVRARLSRGTFHVQRLALMNPAVGLVMTGNVGLNGRLDLEVTGKTGDAGLNVTALRLIAPRVPVAGPVPVSLIEQASSLLANRMIHLRVTGTVRSPTVRIDPISLLSEEAVRVFLNRYFLPLSTQSSLP